ncbi:sigma 54-interacting transcriptional regulator [Flammeovirga sp. SubArs3]|uniref:sigma 54-interacting transcriptional regulator n=1 Tax=Flammeovirga sp. SubArs3 TaxID=2995316 RepID=UPI00248C9C5F|nr:sigma 54-interacting transcriptional regulator [Flammeovirga sp. SubArs3]
MNFLQQINFILIGLFLSLSIFYFIFFLFKKKEKNKIIYAGMSIMSAIYIYFSTQLHTKAEILDYQNYLTITMVIYLSLIQLVFLALFDLTKYRVNKSFYGITGITLLSILLIIYFNNEFVITGNETIKRIEISANSFYYILVGNTNEVYEWVSSIFYLSCLVYFVRLIIYSYKNSKVVFVSCLFLCFTLGGIYDVMIDVGEIEAVYISEYMTALIVVLLSVDLLLHFKKKIDANRVLLNINGSYEDLIENIDLYVIGHDQNQKINYLNRFTEKKFYGKKWEIINKNLNTFFEKEENSENQGKLQLTSDEVRNIEYSKVKVLRGKGKYVDFIVGYDITDKLNEHRQLEQTLLQLKDATEKLEEENTFLKQNAQRKSVSNILYVESTFAKSIDKELDRIANYKTTVLIEGNKGAGKTFLANELIKKGDRKTKPQIEYRCHKTLNGIFRSKYYDDNTYNQGYNKSILDVANGGTLILEDIDELSHEDQLDLLDLLKRQDDLEQQEYDVRILATTTKDIRKLVEEDEFNGELHKYLSIYRINLPDLKYRMSDIPYYVDLFIDDYCKKNAIPSLKVSLATIKKLQSYDWPENIKELKYIVKKAAVSSHGKTLRLLDFDTYKEEHKAVVTEFLCLDEYEKQYITKTLEYCKWKVSGKNSASELLKINEATLRSKLKKLNIHKPKKV